MSELDELLRRARAVAAPADAKARLRARVLGAAALAASSGLAQGAAAAGAKVGGASVGKVTGLGFLAYVGGGVAIGALVIGPLALLGRLSRSEPPALPAPTVQVEGQPSVAMSAPPLSAAPQPLASTPPSLPVVSTPPASADIRLPSIERETLLIGEAQRGLRRGDPRAALAWISRYEAEFPSGVLTEEAAAARAIAACSLSGRERSRTLDQFRSRFPGSPLLPRVVRACSNGHDDFALESAAPATQGGEARPDGLGAEGERQ